MFTSKKFSKIATIAVSAAVMTFAAMEANASHFRYGTMSWTRSQANPLEVTFNITEAWRAAAPDTLSFSGGGVSFNTSENRNTVGTFTDAQSEQYTVFSTSITRTFSSAGVFNVSAGTCCRIGSLQDGNANAYFRMESVVDLLSPFADNTGSPVAQAPIIVPMPITTSGNTTSFQLPLGDPDAENLTVSLASTAQSGLNDGIPTVGGNNLTVSSTGLLEWDTSGASAGQKFAVQLRVDEDDSDNSIPVDFIIEISNAQANQAPTVDGASFNLEVGDVLSHTVTGNDPDNGPSPLSWDPINLITGPQTVSNALFDVNTQLLTWDTAGYATGTYTFFMSNFDGAANGLGQIIVTVSEATVSEPGMALVFGLGLAGIAYTRRRRIA